MQGLGGGTSGASGVQFQDATVFTLNLESGKPTARTNIGNFYKADPDLAVVLNYITANNSNWSIRQGRGTFPILTPIAFGNESLWDWQGEGWGTINQVQANLGTTNDVMNFLSTDYNQGRFKLHDMQFDGNSGSYTSRDIFRLTGGDSWCIERCYMHHSQTGDILHILDGGTTPTYVTYHRVFNNLFKYAGANGIYSTGRDSWFDLNVIETTGSDGISLQSTAGGIMVSNSHVTYAGHNAYNLGTGAWQLLNNYADKPSQDGYLVAGVRGQFTNCRAYDCNYNRGSNAYYAIELAASATGHVFLNCYVNDDQVAGTKPLYGVFENASCDYNRFVYGNIHGGFSSGNVLKVGGNSDLTTGVVTA
jgi:hypothetical protein